MILPTFGKGVGARLDVDGEPGDKIGRRIEPLGNRRVHIVATQTSQGLMQQNQPGVREGVFEERRQHLW